MTEQWKHIVEDAVCLLSDCSPKALQNYCDRRGMNLGVMSYFAAANDLVERASKYGAGNIYGWFLLDKNGNEISIGSKVSNKAGSTRYVRGFYVSEHGKAVIYQLHDFGAFDYVDTVRLAEPDTRESIAADLARDLEGSPTPSEDAVWLANKYADRFLALKEVD